MTNLEWALSYAERGLAVIPCCWPSESLSCGCGRGHTVKGIAKAPLTQHGSKDATADAGIIKGWWQRWPDANIGIATGPISRLHVIDVDNRDDKDGDLTLHALPETLPDTAMATTSFGSYHLYFRLPEGVSLPSVGLGQGVDTRGAGGYVIAAPSFHASGRQYTWIDDLDYMVDLPAWLVPLLKKKERTPADVDDVTVGESLNPPWDQINALIENEPEFAALWNRKPKGGKESSDSTYDWGLTYYLIKAKFSDQQIVDTLVFFARKDGREVKRAGYYTTTIGNQRGDMKVELRLEEVVAQPPPTDSGGRSALVAQLNEGLGLDIARVTRSFASKGGAIQGEATYTVEMINGATSAPFKVATILSFTQFQQRMADASSQVIERKHAKRWPQWGSLILRACEDEELGDGVSDEGIWAELLDDYFAHRGVHDTPEAYRGALLTDNRANQVPFAKDGDAFFYLSSFRAWLGTERNMKPSIKEVAVGLNIIHCKHIETSLRDDEQRVRSARVWRAPKIYSNRHILSGYKPLYPT